MKKYKEYRVISKSLVNEKWHFLWRERSETFDLDRYVMEDTMFSMFDPDKPGTNIVYELFGEDEKCYFGKLIKRTDSLTVWMNWMESVKEVF